MPKIRELEKWKKQIILPISCAKKLNIVSTFK